MNKNILIAMVIFSFLLGFALMGYSLFSSISILPKLSNSTSHINEYKNVDSGVSFGRIFFYEPYIENGTINQSKNSTGICDTLKRKKIVIVNLLYDSEDAPDKCEITADGIFQKSFELQEFLCVDNCTKKIKLSVDLKPQTLYDSHEIELCCDGLCNSKKLDALC